MTAPHGKEPPSERRQEERFPAKQLGLKVELKSLVPGRRPATGELVNVSEGGMAIWLAKELDAGSHWLLTMPDLDGAGVPIKLLRATPAFGGHVHAFKFSTHQAALVERLGGGSLRGARHFRG